MNFSSIPPSDPRKGPGGGGNGDEPPPAPIPAPEQYAHTPGLFEPTEQPADPMDGIDDGIGEPPAPPSTPTPSEEPDDDAVTRIVPVPVRVIDPDTGLDQLEVRSLRLRHHLADNDRERAERADAWRNLRDTVIAQLPPRLVATVSPVSAPTDEREAASSAAPEANQNTESTADERSKDAASAPAAEKSAPLELTQEIGETPAENVSAVDRATASGDVEEHPLTADDGSAPSRPSGPEKSESTVEQTGDAGPTDAPRASPIESGGSQEISPADQLLLGAIADVDAAVAQGDREVFSAQLTALNELLADRNVHGADVSAVVEYLRWVAAHDELAELAYDSAALVQRAIEQQTYIVLSSDRMNRGARDAEREITEVALTRHAVRYQELAALAGELIAASVGEETLSSDGEPTDAQLAQQRLFARVNAVTELTDMDKTPEIRDAAQARLSRTVEENEPAFESAFLTTPEMRAFQSTFAALGELSEPSTSLDELGIDAPTISQPDVADPPGNPHIAPNGQVMGVRLPLLIPGRRSNSPHEQRELAIKEREVVIPLCESKIDAARALREQLHFTATDLTVQQLELEGIRRATETDRPANVMKYRTEIGEDLLVARMYASDEEPVASLDEASELLNGKAQELMLMREELTVALSDPNDKDYEATVERAYESVVDGLFEFAVDTARSNVIATDQATAVGEEEAAGFRRIPPDPVRLALIQEFAASAYAREIDAMSENLRCIAGKVPSGRPLQAQDRLRLQVELFTETYRPVAENTDPVMAPVARAVGEQLEQLRQIAAQAFDANGVMGNTVQMSAAQADVALATIARLTEGPNNPFNHLDQTAVKQHIFERVAPRQLTATELASRPPRIGVPYVPGEHVPTIQLNLCVVETVRRTRDNSGQIGKFYRHKSTKEAQQNDSDVQQLMGVPEEISLEAAPEVILDTLTSHIERYGRALTRRAAEVGQRDTYAAGQTRRFSAERQAAVAELLPELAALPETREGALAAMQKFQQFQEETNRALLGTPAATALTTRLISDAAERYQELAYPQGPTVQAKLESRVANAAIAAGNAVAVHGAYLSELEEQLRLTATEMRTRGAQVRREDRTWLGVSVRRALDNQLKLAALLKTEMTEAFQESLQPAKTAEKLALAGISSGYTADQLDTIADALHDQQLHLPFQPLGSNVSLGAIAAQYLSGGEDPGGRGATPGPRRPDSAPDTDETPRPDVTDTSAQSETYPGEDNVDGPDGPPAAEQQRLHEKPQERGGAGHLESTRLTSRPRRAVDPSPGVPNWPPSTRLGTHQHRPRTTR